MDKIIGGGFGGGRFRVFVFHPFQARYIYLKLEIS
jgi:hypothetical protein